MSCPRCRLMVVRASAGQNPIARAVSPAVASTPREASAVNATAVALVTVRPMTSAARGGSAVSTPAEALSEGCVSALPPTETPGAGADAADCASARSE